MLHLYKYNLIIAVGSSKRGKQSHKQRLRHNQYRKSYDPYDSHGEDGDECTHCDKHSGAHPSGKHSDCCPRYIDTSLMSDKMAFDDDDKDLDMSRSGAPPKRRSIQPLHFPGQVSADRYGAELGQYENDSDQDLNISEEDGSRKMDDTQNAAADITVDRTRAQSSGGSYRHQATRSIRSRHIIFLFDSMCT
jgi:hypothetical protein